mmetsp:Transcript_14929/g.43057  ORF Transcript_14929/g.43057 Transcript_14929/m.43057 type:complete len:254 (+) Transcript_14929:960-1721(+)
MKPPRPVFKPSTFSMPIPFVVPDRPVADNNVSQSKTLPLSNVIRILGSSGDDPLKLSTFVNLVFITNSMPTSVMVRLHASCKAPSSIGTTLSNTSTIVIDSAPSFLKMSAYSKPMIPAPCTTKCFGIRSIAQIVSESYTPGKPKSTGGKRFALEPVAITITSNENDFGCDPSAGENSMAFASKSLPEPCNTSIMKVLICRDATADAALTADDMESLTSCHVFAPRIAASRRHLECDPVGAPVIVPLGSMRPTR